MPKIIIINGPSCAGKSTVISQIFETKKDIFWLKYDSIKRFFVDYDPLVDRQKVIDLVITIWKDRILKWEDILLENYNQEVRDIADAHNYTIYAYNIEAPYDILLQRFLERVANAPKELKINTSAIRHREFYDMYIRDKNTNIKTFDTSIISALDIAKCIQSDIQ